MNMKLESLEEPVQAALRIPEAARGPGNSRVIK